MMKRIMLLCFLLLGSFSTFAQDDCGNGLPCGPVPWDLPNFPLLLSPTPIIVTPALTPTPTNTPAIPPSATPYTIPSPTPFADFSEIGERISTIEAMIEETDEPIYNVQGTPISIGEPETLINEESMIFFSYVKGFNTNTFGILSPVINLLIFMMLTSMLWQLATVGLPIIAILIGVIRKVVQFILDLIPG